MKKYFLILVLFFSVTNVNAITAESLFWVMQQPNLQEALKDQEILKMFDQDQPCRARFCVDYVICGVKQIQAGEQYSTIFTVTRLPGSDIFFRGPLKIETSESSEQPEFCR